MCSPSSGVVYHPFGVSPCRVSLLIIWIAGWLWVSMLSLISCFFECWVRALPLLSFPSLWRSPGEPVYTTAMGWYASTMQQPSWLKDSNFSAPYGLFLPLSYSFDFSLPWIHGQLKGNVCQGLSIWQWTGVGNRRGVCENSLPSGVVRIPWRPLVGGAGLILWKHSAVKKKSVTFIL